MASLTTQHLGGSLVPGGTRAFYNRMAENAFRRLPFFLVPVLLIGVVGMLIATGESPAFRATGVLQATSNPLLGEQPIGNEIQNWETPAAGTSRLINEQLLTETFVQDVAARSGLGEEFEAGLVTSVMIRQNVFASADGTSLLSVSASWADPDTAYQLAKSTIDAYVAYVADSIAIVSNATVEFQEEQRDEAAKDAETAEVELRDYLADLPRLAAGAERPLEEELQITRLSDALTKAEARVDDAQARVDEAKLVVAQSESEAGRTLRIIDAPRVPTAPESTMIKRAITVLTFLILGLIISGLALFLTTVLDPTVRSAADLIHIAGSNIGVVPTFPKRRRARPDDGGDDEFDELDDDSLDHETDTEPAAV